MGVVGLQAGLQGVFVGFLVVGLRGLQTPEHILISCKQYKAEQKKLFF